MIFIVKVSKTGLLHCVYSKTRTTVSAPSPIPSATAVKGRVIKVSPGLNVIELGTPV